MHAASRVRLRVISGDSSRDRLQLSSHLLDRNTAFHLGKALEIEISAGIFLLRNLQRHPQVRRFRKTPTFRHHAHNGDSFAVDRNDAINDVRIGAEMGFPNLVSEQCHWRRALLIFIRPKCPAKDRLHPKKRESVSRDERAEISVRLFPAAQNHCRDCRGAEALQGGRLPFKIEVIRIGNAVVVVAALWKIFVYIKNSILILDVRPGF